MRITGGNAAPLVLNLGTGVNGLLNAYVRLHKMEKNIILLNN